METAMRPAPFEYSRPSTLAAALVAVAGGAVPLAGGQSLLQAMRLRATEPAALVDLNGVAELSRSVGWTDATLEVGALLTHAGFLADARVAAEMPWLHAAARALGDVQVRNLGTVLGNVCWADPRANMPVALLASDAVVRVRTLEDAAERRIPLGDFLTGFRRTALGHGLALGLEVPRRPARGVYLEFSRQRQDLALVNVCVVRAPGHARVVVGGVHAQPLRLTALEERLARQPLQEAVADATLAGLFDGLALEPVRDAHGSPDYKQHLARVLVARALRAVAEAVR
jgi:carbon-monoxide dehydrogenase medium subunit